MSSVLLESVPTWHLIHLSILTINIFCVYAFSSKGNTKDVKELLQQGANPNIKDNAGWTPLVCTVHTYICIKNGKNI